MADAAKAVFAVLVIGIALTVGITIADSITSTTNEFEKDTFTQESVNIEGETGQWVDVRSGELGDNHTVFDSRGNAVRLAGTSDSYVQSDGSFEFATDANWTVATWARVNSSSGSENMTAVSLNGRVLVQYNGTDGNWSVWYFDDGSSDSWRANVSAPNQPGNYSLIVAQHNGTHLTIYRNQTQGDVVNTSAGDNIAPIWVNSTNWHGSIDETRTFDSNITDSQRNSLFNNPIDPVDNKRTGRLMYDAGTGTNVPIYWASTSATASNITWVDGKPGQELDDTILIGDDYDWRREGPQIRPVSGGELDNAPAAFVDYDLTGSSGQTLEDIADAYEFLPVVMIALIAGVIIAVVRRVQ